MHCAGPRLLIFTAAILGEMLLLVYQQQAQQFHSSSAATWAWLLNNFNTNSALRCTLILSLYDFTIIQCHHYCFSCHLLFFNASKFKWNLPSGFLHGGMFFLLPSPLPSYQHRFILKKGKLSVDRNGFVFTCALKGKISFYFWPSREEVHSDIRAGLIED